MRRAERFFSGAAGIAAALLAVAGCHKHTDSLIIVTATPPNDLSKLALTVRVGMTSQTYAVPENPAEVSVGLYVPETVTGCQRVSATAPRATGGCYVGSGSVDVLKAGATVEVTVPMTLQTDCPAATGGSSGAGGSACGGGPQPRRRSPSRR